MKRAILSNDTKGLANEVIKQLETSSMTNLSKQFHAMTDNQKRLVFEYCGGKIQNIW